MILLKLGSFLRILFIYLLQFSFKQKETCNHVCTKTYSTSKAADKANLDFLKKGMLLNYQHHWWVCFSSSFASHFPFFSFFLSLLHGIHHLWPLDGHQILFMFLFVLTAGLWITCLWPGATTWRRIRNSVIPASPSAATSRKPPWPKTHASSMWGSSVFQMFTCITNH